MKYEEFQEDISNEEGGEREGELKLRTPWSVEYERDIERINRLEERIQEQLLQRQGRDVGEFEWEMQLVKREKEVADRKRELAVRQEILGALRLAVRERSILDVGE